ncbi:MULTISPECIES: metallophosphoesterase [Chryseobacterium]|uniref:Icc-related predicted phosphoesterase n=1 Tax=Chryseobacterium camelliae TaxID=1265445 RepID=A0ABU0TIF6_9FLAO|nr:MULTISPECIES: metallophosphoesterase [Chryseobacterium]MDT3409318.1 Icc-related predicted phosphoesterase [Pseudacidovorax intermedius]MDQ1096819.1 Icc-related predicted phosphoesterase [Chryseobacterium camelliae]MDQ1100760.1 Icc-related predicted phosphoesterase [Chryseobacterium sp. SORGH_AS_1048]MDR6088099.1 Icc-related predicted phosphoesterase [Chryseobacterium sp. SORGH_AS_0909]MDR6132474.1 Icc-related predicted phosphoesterase [Chryseobacterium sp. SORGH_AS_1175]
MKIQVISDLHQEFGQTDLCFDSADVVILAGDVNVGIKGIEWIKSKIPDRPVIYVLGNHEYYKGSYPKTLNRIKDAALGSNVHVLENSSVDIDGIRFHGATLWTDFSIFGNPVQYGMLCQSQMNDYKMIRRDPSYSKMRTLDTFKIHQISKAWLEESLEKASGLTSVVVTHHAPSIHSVPEEYLQDPVTAAYASNLEDLIMKYSPDYWIHGHIHTPCRYAIGETEVICNPHGYINEPDNGFNKKLIIDILINR